MSSVACESPGVFGRRQSPRRCPVVFAPLVAVACAIGLPAPAANASTWTNGGGDGLWSNSLNWNGSASSVYRYFTDTAVGPSTADGNRSLWGLYVTNSTGTHSVNLASGTLAFGTFPELHVGNSGTGAIEFSNGVFSLPQAGSTQLRLGYADAAAANGTFIGTSTLEAQMGFRSLSTVGYSEGTHAATAVMNLADSDNGSLTFASFRGGWANGTGNASSTMSFGDNWAFNVGTSGTRGEFAYGYVVSTGTAGASFTTGTGGSFTAYLNSFHVGSSNSGGNLGVSKSSTVDLSGIDNGLIDVNTASGRSFNVGRGAGTSSLELGSNWTVNVNLASTMLIGTDGGTGSLTGTALTLSGSSAFLYVGAHDQGTATGVGTLDMGGGSFGSGLTVGTVRVGVGGSSTGTAKLGSGTFSLTGTIDIGDSSSSVVEGLVELNDTMFTAGASASVNVANSGRLNIFVSDTSSGLILNRNNSAALTIADTVTAGNGIVATFLNNPTGYDYLGTSTSYDSIYWAIKWAGDQTSTLNSFLSTDNIGYDTSGLTGDLAGATPEVIYVAADDATYYGIYVSAVPEPSAMLPACCGLALGAWSLRRRSRTV